MLLIVLEAFLIRKWRLIFNKFHMGKANFKH